MSASKQASASSYALIAGGVNRARVDAGRLRKMLAKIQRLVDSSKERDHLYQVAGDILLAFPASLQRLESQLDETIYALTLMGADHLKDHLDLSSRARVDQTLDDKGLYPSPHFRESSQRVAHAYLAKKMRGS